MAETVLIEDALERFEAAIRQLEMALGTVETKTTQAFAARGEADALRADRAKIVEELDQVRNRANELAQANRQAQNRLEIATRRINDVLGINA